MARLILTPTPLATTAASKSRFGTSAGTIASQAGASNAAATPARNVKISNTFGVTPSPQTRNAKIVEIRVMIISTTTKSLSENIMRDCIVFAT